MLNLHHQILKRSYFCTSKRFEGETPRGVSEKYEIEEMPTARVTRPQATATSAVPPHAQPALSETFGERDRRLFNERYATAVSINNTTMAIAVRPDVR